MDKMKIARKSARFAAKLCKQKGINCVSSAQPFIIICNAGQATGLTKDHITELMISYSVDPNILDKYVPFKGETYSFLRFKNVDSAEVFFNKINGRPFGCGAGNVLILHYVSEIPNTEIVCQYENPKDLHILEEFITKEEEVKYFSYFDWVDNTEQTLKNRQVRHFGYEFRYGTNNVDLHNPLPEKIPELCNVLFERLKNYGFDVGVPDQLTVNKYFPGQGIPSHVDKHSPFGETILSLSLGSDVVMDWRHHSGKQVPVVVPARSLLLMQGEARYDWQHGIAPRLTDPILEHRTITKDNTTIPVKVITTDSVQRGTRISLTFRWTRSGPCQCRFKVLCDSVARTEITDDVAANLEELHVHQVYEQIAGHFHQTRHKTWPRIAEFTAQVPPGACVLDLGSGNGKNVARRGDIFQIAGERSSALLAECKQNLEKLPCADCVRLDLLHPCIRDGCADAVLCIAVIHHFSSHARRQQAVSTIFRLLAPGGRALITVWAKDQSDSNYLKHNDQNTKNEAQSGQNLTSELRSIGDTDITLPVHKNRTQFQHNDVLVPWKLKEAKNSENGTFLRYYHVFEDGELEGLCRNCPNINVVSSFKEEGNWVVICEKVL